MGVRLFVSTQGILNLHQSVEDMLNMQVGGQTA